MIRRVFNVSDKMRLDCYAIANSCAGNMESIYYCLQDWVNKDGRVMFVCECNSIVRGFLVGHNIRNLARVDDLYVDRQFQRSGIGTALLRAYEDYSRKNGAGIMRLQSRATKQAKGFYEKNGFRQISADRFMEKSL